MGEARTFEELIYGPDGDDRNLLAAIRSAVKEAEGQEIGSMRVRCQLTPTGTTSTVTDWNKIFPTKATPEAILAALTESLIASPGEAYSGKIRLSFEESGRSSNRIGSYSRTLRPGPMVVGAGIQRDEDGNPVETHTGSLATHTNDAIRPHVEMTLRALDRGVALLHAGAAMMTSFHQPASSAPQQESGGMLPDLLKGAVGIAAAASGQQTAPQQVVQTFQQVASTGTGYPSHNGRPPSAIPFGAAHRAPSPFQLGMPSYDDRPSLLPPRTPPPRALPGPVAETAPHILTESEVEQWARSNPDKARAMVMRAMSEGRG